MSPLATALEEAERRACAQRDRLVQAVGDERSRAEAAILADSLVWARIIYMLDGQPVIFLPTGHPLAQSSTATDWPWANIAPRSAEDWARMVKSATATAQAALIALETNLALADKARRLCALRDEITRRAAAAAPHIHERKAA